MKATKQEMIRYRTVDIGDRARSAEDDVALFVTK